MIYDEVTKPLVPCIVKFWSTRQMGRGCAEVAVYYLYCLKHNQDLNYHTNTCFNGNNLRIPREQIVKVETDPRPNN